MVQFWDGELYDLNMLHIFVSRPTRARGLKHREPDFRTLLAESRPTRARGLKRVVIGVRSGVNGGRAPRGRDQAFLCGENKYRL